MQESHLSLALYRSKRDAAERVKRDFVYYSPINITEHITPALLQSIVDSLMLPRRHNGERNAKLRKRLLGLTLRLLCLRYADTG